MAELPTLIKHWLGSKSCTEHIRGVASLTQHEKPLVCQFLWLGAQKMQQSRLWRWKSRSSMHVLDKTYVMHWLPRSPSGYLSCWPQNDTGQVPIQGKYLTWSLIWSLSCPLLIVLKIVYGHYSHNNPQQRIFFSLREEKPLTFLGKNWWQFFLLWLLQNGQFSLLLWVQYHL